MRFKINEDGITITIMSDNVDIIMFTKARDLTSKEESTISTADVKLVHERHGDITKMFHPEGNGNLTIVNIADSLYEILKFIETLDEFEKKVIKHNQFIP